MSDRNFAGQPRFTIGGVLSTSFAVLMRNLLPFATVALIIGIPVILVSYWENRDAARQAVAGWANTGQVAVGLLMALLVAAVTQSALIYGTLQDLRGRKVGFSDCLSGGFAVLPRVIPVAIVVTLAVLCGAVLLVVPGVFLAVMWWVAIPVAVVEKVTFGEVFARSRFLTAGKRWQVLGLLLVIIAIQFLISLVVGFVIALAASRFAGPEGADIQGLRWIGSIVQVLVGTFTAVTVAVGYYCLRAEKEGLAIDDIAKVFD